MSEFTQHHHWGIVEHGIGMELWTAYLSEEYFWEFTTPEEILHNTFGQEDITDFLARGGGFLLTDKPDPLPRFHYIELWAYHTDPKMLTWISLKKR